MKRVIAEVLAGRLPDMGEKDRNNGLLNFSKFGDGWKECMPWPEDFNGDETYEMKYTLFYKKLLLETGTKMPKIEIRN